MKQTTVLLLTVLAIAASGGPHAAAQTAPSSPAAQPSPSRPAAPGSPAAPAGAPAAADPPPGYVIGVEDVLGIFFWREKDLTTDAVVRPDGRISIPLLNDVAAAGLTPDQLRAKLTVEAAKYVQDPNVTVVVKQINSRKVFITGLVAKSGTYPLIDHMTVVQLIALAGGLLDFADKENIVVMRAEKGPDGTPASMKVNYAQLMKRVNLQQNIDLKPGDTVIVP